MSLAGLGDSLFEPVPGARAFRQDSPSAEASRAGLLLALSIYAFGTDSAAEDIREDADELEAPQLRPWADFSEDPWDQERIDDFTNRVLAAYEPYDGTAADPEVAARILEGFAGTSNPSQLIALLNLCQRSDSPLEAVSAAAGLRAYSRGTLALSNQILERHIESRDELVRGVVAATLGAAPAPPELESEEPGSNGAARSTQVSTTVHGTWDLVTEDGWYKPGAELHGHLRDRASANLYDDRGYFFWSGGYSAADRAQGAGDLARWRSVVSPWNEELDIVYAHSHGGNVALSAAAAGQRMRMLVLMHTPAIDRTEDEWARIRASVKSVIVMRRRADLVVAADSLRSFEGRQKFDPRKLPHFAVVRSWTHPDAWFSHSFYVNRANWERFDLANIVATRHKWV